MSEREEVITEFDGFRLRSAFEVVAEEGVLSFSIEWPVFEFDEEDNDD
ncbi:hypothetical protein LCGC14_2641010 [marine sediment metagenome]|uniref:Uncharacterized protein n=1 Tax=marine sediment metagenome TaxID=412755 RepID=A0A0F8ZXF4_9ZZZZ